MSDDFRTLREVGVAVGGVRQQMALQTKVFAGVVLIALAVSGFFYTKLDRVEDSTARVETRLDAIQATLNEIRQDTRRTTGDLGAIKGVLKVADAPSKDAFPGYVGAKIDNPAQAGGVLQAVTGKPEIWIFSNDPKVLTGNKP
ncbi:MULTISPECIES: hypothetical protein [unclassified Chelatococcus]|uniref:hypothetical protein n=1 Tax=unclassified Chelatococcus TaxID=2638111 RepID=UPI001BCE76BA|nr:MULTISPECIES: hypothetical protein [unclassified Chelatococcus]MBS7697853.1 hypothetical protein [Chelatococcus sp. YT9]MBX3559792.1 hypothetical protein [Chelatococcus sp.]